MFERTEDETNELVKSWLLKYGIFIGIFIVIIIGLIWFIFNQKQNKIDQNIQEKAKYFSIQDDLANQDITEAIHKFSAFNSNSSYASITALELAKYAFNHDEKEKANEYLNIASHSTDSAVKDTAYYGLLQIHLSEGKYAEALADVEKLNNGIYALELPVIVGDIYYKQGDLAKALNSYQQSVYANQSNILQKINVLKAQILLNNNNQNIQSVNQEVAI